MITNFKSIVAKSKWFDPKVYETNEFWAILEKLYDYNYGSSISNEAKIPKLIHQIWVGENPIPEMHHRCMKTWQKFHPDWKYILWNDEKVKQLELPQVYHTITNPGQKSDFIRYYVLYRYGGIYADCDFECVKNFEPLLSLDFFTGVGYSIRPELYIGLIGSIPEHQILKRLIRAMIIIRDKNWKDIFDTTGAYFFTKIFFNTVEQFMPSVVAFPIDYFYPVPNYVRNGEYNTKDYITDDTFAVHHWGTSWISKKVKHD